MTEFGDKLNEMKPPRAERVLSAESQSTYLFIKCSTCRFRETCPNRDSSDGGCGLRKTIYERLFAPIDFKIDDPLTVNRLRLTSHYFTELMLLRTFGVELRSDEIVLLKVALDQLGKLYIDKKGDLLDQKSKTALPWEQTPELEKLRREVDEARSMRSEYDKLRAQEIERKKKAPNATDK
jgi:hypothetical protein